MLSLPGDARVFLCLTPVDMRLGFDRLASLVSEAMGENPLSGQLFVFPSRRRDRVKILYWDRDGLALWYKRLERGTFPFPAPEGSPVLTITSMELSALLEGVNPLAVRKLGKSRRFSLP
ncbi:MAG: IS66 family insertion sequence element accessory protein TnpB [Planctomycetota bacterium]|jgi:transposase|nr:IS66 family insertion sequence element accessory protein TnpB [Planctomycetota bacterium]